MHKTYFAIVIGGLLALETCCRVERETLFESTHRALFKLAMYRKHGKADVVFFGTSRTGEALRPHLLAPTNAFNCSVQFSSLDILADVIDRVVDSGLRPEVAVIEVSRHQLHRAPLPWAAPETSASALYSLRKAFVLDSLARFVGVALLSSWFDGSEQFGIDYVDSLLGKRRGAAPETATIEPVVYGKEDGLPPLANDEVPIYAKIVDKLKGTKVIFYAPPFRGGEPPGPEFELVQRHIAQLAPLYDFSRVTLPDDYFRDDAHMSHKGGLVFTREFARRLDAL